MDLHLQLKKEWFEKTLKGIKKEDYREISLHYIGYLFNWKKSGLTKQQFLTKLKSEKSLNWCKHVLKQFKTSTFSNGMNHPIPKITLKQKEIKIDFGNPDWGAIPRKKYFVIVHGELMNHENCEKFNSK